MRCVLMTVCVVLARVFAGLAQTESVFDYLEPIRIQTTDNYSTFESTDGFIWVCAEQGLTKFNFEKSQVVHNKGGTAENDVWRTFSDKFGRRWLVHAGRVASYLKNGRIYQIAYPDDMQNIVPDSYCGDTVYFATRGSHKSAVMLLPNGKFQWIRNANGKETLFRLSNNNVHVYRQNERMYYTVAGGKPIPLKRPLTSISLTANESPYNEKVFYVVKDPSRKKDTIVFFKNGRFEFHQVDKYFGKGAELIWLRPGTAEGIVKTPSGVLYYDDIITKRRNRLMEPAIDFFYKKYGMNFHPLIDSNGNLWITVNRGVVYFISLFWLNLETVDLLTFNGNPEKYVITIETDAHKSFLIKNLTNDLYYWVPETNKKELLFRGTKITKVQAINQKNYWITGEYLYIQNPQTGDRKQYKHSMKKPVFVVLDKDRVLFASGELLDIHAGTRTRLLSTVFTHQIEAMKVFGKQIVVQTDSEILFYDWHTDQLIATSQTLYPHKSIIHRNHVVTIQEKKLLFLNEKGKIVDTLKFVEPILDVTELGEDLIVASNNWFYLVAPVQASSGSKFATRKAYYSDLNEQNVRIRTINRWDNEDFILIGTNVGLMKLNWSELERSYDKKGREKVHWELVVNGTVRANASTYTFDYWEKDIVVKLDALSYATMGNLSYYYRLNGINNFWKESRSDHLEFHSLPAGKYTLEIYANNGILSSEIYSTQFNVRAPFWQTSYFYAGIWMVVILFNWWLIRYIVKRKQQEYKNKHRLLELELSSLKNQLNPHFIYNSLNSLQSLVYKKNDLVTNQYIVSLSRLMRTLLDNTRSELTSVYNEIEFLNHYITIQSLRLTHGIEYSITCNASTEVQNTLLIRNMVVQPFVENAIIHGLQAKDGEKKLRVHFEVKRAYVEVTVEDNGIGRESAAKINTARQEKRKSYGTTILQEKSEILRTYFDEHLNYSYEDLYYEGEACGTKVTIYMTPHVKHK